MSLGVVGFSRAQWWQKETPWRVRMVITGSRALRLWGACHALRVAADSPDKKATKRARIEYKSQLLCRERDALIAAYAQRDGKGKPTKASLEREKNITSRYAERIKKTQRAGYGDSTVPMRPDPYARSSKALTPIMHPESPIGLIFMAVDNYLSTRPMQRALAWRVYVEGSCVRAFRYSETREEKTVTYCGSGTAAVRVHRSLKERLDIIFIRW